MSYIILWIPYSMRVLDKAKFLVNVKLHEHEFTCRQLIKSSNLYLSNRKLDVGNFISQVMPLVNVIINSSCILKNLEYTIQLYVIDE